MDAPATTPEPQADEPRPEPPTRTRTVLRYARRFATPAAIVFAWAQVVRNWGASDTDLFNWATVTAAVVLAVVTIAWLLSLRFRRLRRALLPLEGGIVVGALVLALSTSGQEVDMVGDHVAVAFVFGIITTILLGIVLPLVEGRGRAWAWTGGTIALVAIAGISLPAALDWLEGDIYGVSPLDAPGGTELLARMDDDGFRLGSTQAYAPVSTLRDGYVVVDPYGVSALPVGIATTSDPMAPGVASAEPAPQRSDWARLSAAPDGAVTLAVDPAIADGVEGNVVATLRRGSCSATGGRTLDEFRVPTATGRVVRRAFPVDVDDLSVDDRYSLVVGVDARFAPTRCAELLDGSAIILAQLGAHRFDAECMAELDMPRGQEYLVDASSFQDAECAERFTEYRDIAASLVVPKARVAQYRRCVEERELHLDRTERVLRDGTMLVRYDVRTGYGDCVTLGTNFEAYVNGSMSGGFAVPIDAATGLPAEVYPVAPTGAAPAPAPTPVAPAGAIPATGVSVPGVGGIAVPAPAVAGTAAPAAAPGVASIPAPAVAVG